MKPAQSFASALIAVGVVACIGTSASACERYQKQVLAKAETPPADQQTATSSTPIDPMRLAELQSQRDDAAVEKQ
jgi:hypothetical protein